MSSFQHLLFCIISRVTMDRRAQWQRIFWAASPDARPHPIKLTCWPRATREACSDARASQR